MVARVGIADAGRLRIAETRPPTKHEEESFVDNRLSLLKMEFSPNVIVDVYLTK